MDAEPSNEALADALVYGVDDSAIFEHIFEESPLPIAIYDQRGNLHRRNDAHISLVDALGGATGLGEFNVLEDSRSKAFGHAAHFARAYAGATLEYRFSCVQSDSGPERSLHFSHLLMPMRAGSAGVVAVVGVIADITEQEQGAQERMRFQQRLAQVQKLESLGLLAGGISHDFNNLLVAVLGNASYLRRRLEPESPLHAHVKAIETAARRAADIAQQMLVYAGRGRATFQDLDIGELVREMSELLRVSISKRARLRISCDAGLPPVRGDGTQLRQVVMNLITNASEALVDGKGEISVRTGFREPAAAYLERCFGAPDPAARGFVFIEVQDDGCGMDPDIVSRAFDPFFTTKFTGRGLGLSAVLGILRRHRAALHIASTPGVGTTMTVLLPSSGRPAALECETAEPASVPLPPGLRVLVVDDDANVRDVARSLLVELGCEVHTAENGDAALHMCTRLGPELSLVIMDVTMPGPDGLETAEMLRARHVGLPILLTSGGGPPRALEGRAFLQKPFTLEDLQAAVALVLAQAHSLASLRPGRQ